MYIHTYMCREDLKACQDRLEAMRLKRDALIVELEHAVESNNQFVLHAHAHTHTCIHMRKHL